MSRADTLQQYFQEYQRVALSLRGRGEPMSVNQGLSLLSSIAAGTQVLSPLLSKKAKELSNEIVFGSGLPNGNRKVS